MTTGHRFHTVLSVALCGLFLPTILYAGSSSVEDARRLAARVADRALEAVLARDIAMKAVENAIAVQDEAEADVMAAMASGESGCIKRSRRALADAMDETGEAVSLTAAVVAYAVQAGSAATSADEQIKTLDDANPSAVDAAIRRLRGLLRIAECAARKALKLTDRMKTRWLVAPVQTPAATTSLKIPDPPPTPTPVGRR